MRSKFNQAHSSRTNATYRVSALAFCLGLAVSGISGHAAAQEQSAAAQEKLVCSQSFEQAQRLRNDTKYVAANQELLKCANPRCGDALFQECSKLYAELQAAIPSVVFQARDATNGQELVDVTVTLEGRTLTQQLDGKPVVVDPGSHKFTFLAPDAPPVEKLVVVRAGEKFRQIVVVLDLKSSKSAAPPPVAPPPRTEPVASSRHVPVGTWVLGGVGVVAIGTSLVLRAVGASDFDSLASSCAPTATCSQSDVDKVKQKYLFSNIALGVGAAALAGAVVVYFVQPRESSGSETAFVVGPTRDGLFARAVTRF